MRILILGSEGFIGSHCVDYYLSVNEEVYGADLKQFTDKNYRYFPISGRGTEVNELFQKVKYDAVINAAGSGNVNYSMTNPLEDFEANSYDTAHILDALRKFQPQTKYLHISSAAVYGNPAKQKINENDEPRPISPYGWHKLIAENLCREYYEIFNLKTAIIRPFSVYGPGLRKQLFWDLYQKTKNTNGKITLWGTGNESRDYIYISDLVESVNCIINSSPMQNDIYNAATGVETTISAAARVFFKYIGGNINYEFNGITRPGDPLNWNVNNDKLKNLGFSHKIDLESGLFKLVSWLKSV